MGDHAPSNKGAKTATHKHSFKSRDGQKEARKRETADCAMEKGEKNEHLQLLTLPQSFNLIKTIKNKNVKKESNPRK